MSNLEEQKIREAVVHRLRSQYPSVGEDFSFFLDASRKISVNTWAGDAFAWVMQEQQLMHLYDEFRSKFFYD